MLHAPRALIWVGAWLVVAAAGWPALACGWWGDGEMDATTNVEEIGPDGRPLAERNARAMWDPAELRIPGRHGFGFAVRRPDRALPYLRLTGGRPINEIGELRGLGFAAVVDLATPAEEARVHRAETVGLGMRYFSIPVTRGLPSAEQARRFSSLLEDRENRPLLVFAVSADLLGTMWTVHRVHGGAGWDAAFAEGRALGLTYERENDLDWHLRNGTLKALRPAE